MEGLGDERRGRSGTFEGPWARVQNRAFGFRGFVTRETFRFRFGSQRSGGADMAELIRAPRLLTRHPTPPEVGVPMKHALSLAARFRANFRPIKKGIISTSGRTSPVPS